MTRDPQRRSIRWTPVLLTLALAGTACDKKKDDAPAGDKGKTEAKADAKDTKADAKAGDTKAGDGGGGGEKVAAGPCPDGMVLIEGGKFFMGSQSEDKILASARPAHKVELDSFCIDKNEVTTDAFKKCSDEGECEKAHADVLYPQGSAPEDSWIDERKKFAEFCNVDKEGRGEHPINCVTWAQATAYCKWKDERLPTEAEWEFAARGSDGRVFPWGDEKPTIEHGNMCGLECTKWRADHDLAPHNPEFEENDKYPGTAPVGSFKRGITPDGILDMIGNAFEWTATPMHQYTEEEQKNPKGPADGDKYVIRGGAFNSFMTEFTDPALRFGQDKGAHVHAIGFRCAANPKK